jgi:hypothetical protein
MNSIDRRLRMLEGTAIGRGGPHLLFVMPGETLEEAKAKHPKPIRPDDEVQVFEVVLVA